MSNNDKFTSFYSIWTKPVKGTGSMKPMRRTFNNLQEAKQAIEQMTEKYPNKKFFIMHAIERYVTEDSNGNA